MLDLGTQELIVIFIVAFLVFGPKKMPELARTLGKGLKQLKTAMRGITESLEEAGADIKEEVADIKEEVNEATGGLQDSIYKSIESNIDEINKATENISESKKVEDDDTPRLFGDSEDEDKQQQENISVGAEEESAKENKKEPKTDG
jgi:sec-independent protein translocase protein TatB